MTSKKWACLSAISISLVFFAATIVTITEFGIFGVAHGQVTPQQKAAICDPSNPKLNFVNSTESKLCGIPKSVKSNMSNTTTSPSSAPFEVPTPSQ